MSTKLVFMAMARPLEACLMVGALVFQSACTLAQTAFPGKIQGDGAGKSHSETMLPITPLAATAVSPQEVEPPSEGNPKLESSLNQLLEAYRRGGLADAQSFAQTHGMVLDGNRVQVEVIAATEAVNDLRAAIEALGGEYQGHHETLVQALVPLDALEVLARRPEVQVIREPRRVIP